MQTQLPARSSSLSLHVSTRSKPRRAQNTVSGQRLFRVCSTPHNPLAVQVTAYQRGGRSGNSADTFTNVVDGDKSGLIPYEEDKFVAVGTISVAHGIKGEVKVQPLTDEPEDRFQSGKRLYLLPFEVRASKRQQQQLIRATVERGRPVGSGGPAESWAVKFRGVNTRTEAEQLRKWSVLMALEDRPPAEDGEYYAVDLVGLQVFLQDSKQHVGEVMDLYSGTGTHDTLRIQLRLTPEDINKSQLRTVLVPFVKDICPVVDVAEGRLELLPPQGLLNLVTTIPMQKPLTADQKQELSEQLQQVQLREQAVQASTRGAEPAEPTAAMHQHTPSSSSMQHAGADGRAEDVGRPGGLTHAGSAATQSSEASTNTGPGAATAPSTRVAPALLQTHQGEAGLGAGTGATGAADTSPSSTKPAADRRKFRISSGRNPFAK